MMSIVPAITASLFVSDTYGDNVMPVSQSTITSSSLRSRRKHKAWGRKPQDQLKESELARAVGGAEPFRADFRVEKLDCLT